MPLEIEFLNHLYRCKFEAEQNLEMLQAKDHTDRPAKDADWMIKIEEMEINHVQEVVNRYTNLISTYLVYHHK